MGRTEYNLERNTSRYFSKALHSKFTCVKSSPTRGIRNKGLAYTLHPAARAPWIVAAQTQLRLKPPPFPNMKRRGARSEQIFRQAESFRPNPFAHVMEGRHALETIGELRRPA